MKRHYFKDNGNEPIWMLVTFGQSPAPLKKSANCVPWMNIALNMVYSPPSPLRQARWMTKTYTTLSSNICMYAVFWLMDVSDYITE